MSLEKNAMSCFEKIGVVGAGMMGSEIALVFALAGHPTILSDRQREFADRALDRLDGVLDRGVGRKVWSAEAAANARRNLSVVDGLDDYADRDLVIEAVFEDANLKREVFKRLDAILDASAGLASNASSISITAGYDGRKAGRVWRRYDKDGKRL
jgi:3-hydroxybutyryl-CoA dehydrogenase